MTTVGDGEGWTKTVGDGRRWVTSVVSEALGGGWVECRDPGITTVRDGCLGKGWVEGGSFKGDSYITTSSVAVTTQVVVCTDVDVTL